LRWAHLPGVLRLSRRPARLFYQGAWRRRFAGRLCPWHGCPPPTFRPKPDRRRPHRGTPDRAVRELQAIRMETIARSTNVIGRLIVEVEKDLAPTQQQAFEAMKPKPADMTLDLLNVAPKPGCKP
jgi:hypothetical protein